MPRHTDTGIVGEHTLETHAHLRRTIGDDDLPGDGDEVTRATDWVAGMTDRYCIRAYDELLAPR